MSSIKRGLREAFLYFPLACIHSSTGYFSISCFVQSKTFVIRKLFVIKLSYSYAVLPEPPSNKIKMPGINIGIYGKSVWGGTDAWEHSGTLVANWGGKSTGRASNWITTTTTTVATVSLENTPLAMPTNATATRAPTLTETILSPTKTTTPYLFNSTVATSKPAMAVSTAGSSILAPQKPPSTVTSNGAALPTSPSKGAASRRHRGASTTGVAFAGLVVATILFF